MALVLATALSGCVYDAEEPGLFGPQVEPTPTPSPTAPDEDPTPVRPVAGEAVWSLGTGSRFQVRVVVHAVRRVEGGTVLDWSLTPLPGDGLPPGRAVPDGRVWGLRSVDIRLLDPVRGLRYAPLTSPDGERCLCTEPDASSTVLRVGRTSLQQAAFPALPATVGSVDVVIPIVPVFGAVPVAPVGTAPPAEQRTDLARAAARPVSLGTSPTFNLPPAEQRFAVELDEVQVGRTFTSVAWRVRAVTAGAGLIDVGRLPVPQTRRGRRVSVGSSAQTPSLSSRKATRGPTTRHVTLVRSHEDAWARCLCTDPRPWAQLGRPGDQLSVVTTLPPMTDPTAYAVDVAFPGLVTFTDVGISAAPFAAGSRGTTPYRARFWPAETPAEIRPDAPWPTRIPTPGAFAAARASRPTSR